MDLLAEERQQVSGAGGVGHQPSPVTSATLALTALQDSLQHRQGHQYLLPGTERKGTWVLTLPQSS